MLCNSATFRRRKKKKTLILSDGVCFSVTDQNLSKSSKNRLSYILMQFTTNIKAIKRRLYDAGLFVSFCSISWWKKKFFSLHDVEKLNLTIALAFAYIP